MDLEGQPYWQPEADQALFSAIRQHLHAHIPLIEMNLTINDPVFAQRAAEMLLQMIEGKASSVKYNT